MNQARQLSLRSVRLHRLLIVLSVAIPLAAFAVAAMRDRAQVLREGEETMTRTAAVMHEHARKVFETVDLALARVDDRVAGLSWEKIAAPETSAFLARLKAPLDHVVSIWVTDASGSVRAGSQAWDRSILLHERDFFAVHQEHDAGTYVSAPFRGRATGVASIAVSRRRSTPDGRFDGTIHVALSPEYLARAFAEAAPPMPHAAALVRADGEVLAREPYREVSSRLGPASPLMQAIARQPDGGLIVGRSSVDGLDRVYAYRKVSGYPVYVGFGTETAEVMRRWYGNLTSFGLVSAVAALTLLLVSWLALRAAIAERAALARLGATLDELRRSELRLQRGNAELEERVGERTTELAEGEARLAALVRATSDVLYRMSPDWTEMRDLRGTGFIADTTAPKTGWMEDYIHPDDRAAVAMAIAEAIRGRSAFELEHRVRRPDGSFRWTLSRAVPLQGPGGEIREWFGAARDVTARREAEEALVASEARLRLAGEAGGVGLFSCDLVTGRTHWSETMYRLCGLDPGMPLPPMEFGGEHLDLVHPHDRAGLRAARTTLAADTAAERFAFEFRIRRAGTGEIRWIASRGEFVRDAAGRAVAVRGAQQDVTDRREAEERLRLMVDELNHRVKNTLATVQSIAAQSLRGADPAVRRKLEARLLALAAAHDVLTREGWAGANIDDVVTGVLAPHGGREGGRFRVSGPPLRVAPRAAVALSMALHELATNALKYGALSVSSGEVEIRWEALPSDVPRFRLTWTERGGPPVVPPAQRGFGTKLVERSLAQDLGGTARIEFAPEGVVCRVEAPLAGVAAPAEVVPLPRVRRMMGD